MCFITLSVQSLPFSSLPFISPFLSLPSSSPPVSPSSLTRRSKHPLDTPVRKQASDCLCVSAGHDKHEYTSGAAYSSVFDFLLRRIEVFPTEARAVLLHTD